MKAYARPTPIIMGRIRAISDSIFSSTGEMLLQRFQRVQRRCVSSSTLATFEWRCGSGSWSVPGTVVSPDTNDEIRGTIVLLPTVSLLSTREEWRECAEYLADIGYRSILVDWPGWSHRSPPLNWAVENDLTATDSASSLLTDFAHTIISSAQVEYGDAPMSVGAAGGVASIHALRATSKMTVPVPICSFSPTWRFYLTRYVPEGYPRKLARRRAIAEWFLANIFCRSRTLFNIYKSKLGLSKISRRFYEDKIQHDSNRLEAKREVILRDRPLSIDSAMILGRFCPVESTQEFISELLTLPKESETESPGDDSDDDDNLLNIKVPEWTKRRTESTTQGADPTLGRVETPNALHLVIPEDAVPQDRKEMDLVEKWANGVGHITVSTIPGRLACHEESPALSASIIHDFLHGRPNRS
jgi:hypothetical protein